MITNNSGNIKFTNSTDGFIVAGGTTTRSLTLTGGDVSMIGSGSATIVFPSSSGTLYATGNTDVALADGGTGASLTDPGADRILFWDESANAVTWLTPGSGITITGTTISTTGSVTVGVYDYIVYQSGGTTYAYKTSDGTTLSSDTDSSIPLQAAVDACDATSGTGGRIYVQPGTYAMSSTVTIQGNQTTDSKMVSIHCSGIQTTIFKPSVNVTAFTVSNRAKVSMRDFAIIVRGSGNGITSTNSSVGQRAFWISEFRNIFIYDDGTSTAHSAWGMNLGNPFRSVLENIEMNQVKNGLKLEALDTSTGYNPGDLTVNRMFIELQSGATSGTAIELASPSTGDFNQATFNMIEMIGTGTNQTAILFSGAAGSVNHTKWTGINIEEFKTILDIQSGYGNDFEFNYIVTQDAASTTYFKFSSNALANRVLRARSIDSYAQNVTLIDDANTDFNSPNTIQNIRFQGSATGVTVTKTTATILRHVYDSVGSNSYIDIADSQLQDPNADRLYFWDDSTNRSGLLTLGGGMSITGTTMNQTKYILVRVLDSATTNATGTTIGGDIEIPITGTITEIGAYVDTAGTTGLMTIDINKNGTTLMTTNKVTLDSTEKSSRTAATAPVLTTTAITAGDLITVDVDAIQTTPAKGLTIRLGILQS